MRDLNECTAEVFRRGEQRIKARRRNRGRVLAVCIPVFLIAAVWPAVNLSVPQPGGTSGGNAQPAGEMVGNAPPGSLACPYTTAEIQDFGMSPEGHYEKVTDAATVAEMFRAVHSLFADAGGSNQLNGGNFPAEEENAYSDRTESTSFGRGHTVTFTTGEGAQTAYTLSGNMLVNVSTNETVFLSDAQTAGLLAVLGIPE